jgi:PAS domain S-box-containing protein
MLTAESEKNFQSFFHHIKDFLFVLDTQGNILEINNAVTRVLGYTTSEAIGQSVLNMHPPECRAEAKEIVGKMLAGLQSSCPLPLITKNGVRIPVETSVYHGKWNNEDAIIGVSRNLSELALSESKFHTVFNNSHVLMAISDIDTGVFININQTFLEKLGYEEAEIIGKSSKDLMLFANYEQRAQILTQLQDRDKVENVQISVNKKDGSNFICLFSLTKIQIQTYQYLLTSAIDISDVVQVESKLKHNLKQQQLLAEISQSLHQTDHFSDKLNNILEQLGEHTNVSRVYIFEDDPSGLTTNNTFEWCNQNITPQKEELQDVPYSIIPSWKKFLVEDGKVFSTNISELPQDLIDILAPQGIKSILALPLYIQNKFSGFIGFDECINNKVWAQDEIDLLRTIANIFSNSFERIRYQQQLRESEARLKMAIENTETGLWDCNVKTGDTFYNEVWSKMLGYDHSEIAPHYSSWQSLVHPDDLHDAVAEYEKHLAGEVPMYEATHRLKTKDGGWKWIIDKGKVVERDAEGNPTRAIGTHTDINRLKQIENELRVANATKDKFFSIIAHDLRGPIGSMMQIAELVSQKGSLQEEVLYKFLNSQKEISKTTYDLLENLLGWARINQSQITVHATNIKVCLLVKKSIELSKFRADSKQITITSDLVNDCLAFADEDMIKLVVRNLLSNALKFTKQQGVIHCSCEQKDDCIEIKIADNGVGISQDDLALVLSENEFHTTYGTNKEKGSGLGLKLCKQFVQLNGGELRATSTPGVGTTLIFTLPIAK